MSHYAKVVNGIVVNVITAEANFFMPKSEGGEGFVDNSPGTWIQTSYNTFGGKHYNPTTGVEDTETTPALRANYAGIGFNYDATHDVFYAPRPIDCNGISCASWTISALNWLWKPPVAYPTDNKNYVWDEPTKSWIVQ